MSEPLKTPLRVSTQSVSVGGTGGSFERVDIINDDDTFTGSAHGATEAEAFANAAEIVRRCNAFDEIQECLAAITRRYIGLVNSGDCGNWNPEEEPEVKRALAFLATAKPERSQP